TVFGPLQTLFTLSSKGFCGFNKQPNHHALPLAGDSYPRLCRVPGPGGGTQPRRSAQSDGTRPQHQCGDGWFIDCSLLARKCCIGPTVDLVGAAVFPPI